MTIVVEDDLPIRNGSPGLIGYSPVDIYYDNVKVTVSLIAPIAMEEGLRFAVREGGRTVGAGVVSKVIE